MITTANLKDQSWKDLAQLAKKKGLSGWQSMRKEQLVKALAKFAKVPPSKSAKKAAPQVKSAKNGASRTQSGGAIKRGKAVKPIRAANGSLNGSAKAHVPAKGLLAAKMTLPVKSPSAAARNGAHKVNPAAKNSLSPRPLEKPVVAIKPPAAAKPAAPIKAMEAPPKPPVPVKPEPPVKPTNPRAVQKIAKVHSQRERSKDLSAAHVVIAEAPKRKGADKDRLVLMVRDSYWLQACWNVTAASVKRAEAALAEHWHTAHPVLRLLEVATGHTTNTSERVMREIDVHGGVKNWYIDVTEPPHSYRVALGYRAANGKFFTIARSNAVSTPAPGSNDAIDSNWDGVAENYEKVYAMSGGYSEEQFSGDLQELFEERLHRPMNNPLGSQFGSGAERVLNRHRDFQFQVDAELVLFGHTKPDARVTLAGEPVKLRSDGSFAIRLSMPDKRQVLPVVASSANGVEQRTVVIAVERNTKVLEPMLRDSGD